MVVTLFASYRAKTLMLLLSGARSVSFRLFHRPLKARVLGVAAACGTVVAAVRSAFLPAGILGLLSVVLVVTQGGIES